MSTIPASGSPVPTSQHDAFRNEQTAELGNASDDVRSVSSMTVHTRESMKLHENKRILDRYDQEFKKNRLAMEKLERVIADRCSDSADPESQTSAQIEALIAGFQAESAHLDTEIASLERDIVILQEATPEPNQSARPPSQSRTAAHKPSRSRRK
jgi:hypothetical protein